MKYYICCGPSGNGKSSFIKKNTGMEVKIGDGFDSCTKSTTKFKEYIDTQGTQDTSCKTTDRDIFFSILKECVGIEIAGFLIFQHIGEQKFHIDSTIDFLKIFFGDTISTKIGIVYTGCKSVLPDKIERHQKSAKPRYSSYPSVDWDSNIFDSSMATQLNQIKDTLEKSPVPIKIKKFFEEIDEQAKKKREQEKYKESEPYYIKVNKPCVSKVKKNFIQSDSWRWEENSSSGLTSSFLTLGITSIVKENSFNEKLINTGIPYDSKIITNNLSMSVRGSDCWDEDHSINLSGNNVKLWSKLRYAKCRAGYAWVEYSYSIDIVYEADGIGNEEVDELRYKDVTKYKHDLEFYKKQIFGELFNKYFEKEN